MESKKEFPTAEQFIKRLCPLSKTLTIEGAINLAHEYAVLFAKHHRREMVEAVVENELVNGNMHKEEESNYRYSIENAYEESKIV